MIVPLRCPLCDRMRAYNGRGRCRCGAYLVDHLGNPMYFAPDDLVFLHNGRDQWEGMTTPATSALVGIQRSNEARF